MPRTNRILPFAIATIVPTLLLIFGLVAGGLWAAIALLYVMALVPYLDMILPFDAPAAPDRAAPPKTLLCVFLALSHFGLLGLAILTLSFNSALQPLDKVLLFLAAGLFFGQVSNSNAHELIHSNSQRLHRLGTLVYISLLYGHHATAHRLVHHRWVATPLDPNSATRGQSFYNFAPVAWVGSFRKGFHEANIQRKRIQNPLRSHPYMPVIALQILAFLGVGLAFGGTALIIYLSICAYAQIQLLLSDYVQHYGLRRHRLADGRWSQVTAAHSWDAPHIASAFLMLNAPHHAEHHMNATIPFHALRTAEETPKLPYSLPVMAAIALVPPLWRRAIHPHLDQFQDKHHPHSMDYPASTA